MKTFSYLTGYEVSSYAEENQVALGNIIYLEAQIHHFQKDYPNWSIPLSTVGELQGVYGFQDVLDITNTRISQILENLFIATPLNECRKEYLNRLISRYEDEDNEESKNLLKDIEAMEKSDSGYSLLMLLDFCLIPEDIREDTIKLVFKELDSIHSYFSSEYQICNIGAGELLWQFTVDGMYDVYELASYFTAIAKIILDVIEEDL